MTLKGGILMSNKDPYTRDEDARFTLRINAQVLDIIKNVAQQNKRSTGKQIEFILEQWISQNVPQE